MKSNRRALLTAFAMLGLFTSAAEVRADSKQECAFAYGKTQALRDSGQLREARIQAVACSASTCSVYVTQDCRQWLTEIDAILPTVLFTAEDDAVVNVLAVRVSVDGQPVAERLDGDAVALDPGEHTVRFEMTGAEAVEQKVTIRQGEKNRRLAVLFKKASPPPPAPSTAVLPPRPPPPAVVAAKPAAALLPSPDGGSGRLWAAVFGTAGVVALGVSAGFGVSAVHAQDQLVVKCGGDAARCPVSTNAETLPLAEQRTRDRNVAIGVGVVGLISVAVAVIGFAISPSKASTRKTCFVLAPVGSPSAGGLEIQGQF